MGEINSDDDERNDSSDDTFDHVHKVSCANVDGCSGMDEANADYADKADYKVNDDSSGGVESNTEVTDRSSERDKDYTIDTRTYRDPVNVTLSDVDVEMDDSGSDTDDAGNAVIEVSDTSTSAESSNEDVVEVVMIE